MSMGEFWGWLFGLTFLTGFTLTGAVVWAVRKRNMHLWLGSYLRFLKSHRNHPLQPALPNRSIKKQARGASGSRAGSVASSNPNRANEDSPVEVFVAVCDHYEPEWGQPTKDVALERVERWCREYPRLFSSFRDANGRVPQHTFFFPQDQYRPEYLDRLAELCEAGFGDVDVHLHHHNDTPEGLREKLEEFRETLYHRHGLLRRDPVTGEIVYGFIHGNWALCNARPDGRWCGVDHEIPILRQTGCYADFTMPSAPSDTQTRTINSIYYATDQPGKTKSHDTGTRARVGQSAPSDSLLMIQGPLMLNWQQRKRGLFPSIENGDLHLYRKPNRSRLKLWLQAGIHVADRPNWIFIKLHTHGCKEGNIDMWLGEPMQQLHRDLAQLSQNHETFRFHYVTAWEMAQLVHQAEAGATSPNLGKIGSSVSAGHSVIC